MIRLTFVEPDGTVRTIDSEEGISLMRAARDSGIAGIVADCGGQCACATCHAYLDVGAAARVPAPTTMEQEMLTCAIDVRATSRLTCQVRVTSHLDGAIVTIPATQF